MEQCPHGFSKAAFCAMCNAPNGRVYTREASASDKTNMFAAPTYLRRDFDLSNEDACKVVKDWMNSFSERHPEVVNRGAG